MGREWRRRFEIRTDQCRTAGGSRPAREEGHERLSAPHPFPYRFSDNEDPSYSDGSARGLAVLCATPQDGL